MTLQLILKDMEYFGLNQGDLDKNGYVTLYHGGINMPEKLKKDEILFLTYSKELALDYANMRSHHSGKPGKVFEFKVKPEDVSWNQGSQEIEYSLGGTILNGCITPPEKKISHKRQSDITEFKGVEIGEILPKSKFKVMDIVIHDEGKGKGQFLLKRPNNTTAWHDADMVVDYEFKVIKKSVTKKKDKDLEIG